MRSCSTASSTCCRIGCATSSRSSPSSPTTALTCSRPSTRSRTPSTSLGTWRSRSGSTSRPCQGGAGGSPRMLQDFKAFLMRGNVLDLAVGIIIGGAFGTIVSSLVNDVIMPPIGLGLGKVDFSNLYLLLEPGIKAAPPYASVAEARAAGAVTINYGLFINSIISFLIVGFAVFMVVRAAARLQRPEAAVTPIGELLDNASKYNNKTVRIEGEVKGSAGALGKGAYQVNDRTGTLTVISEVGDPPRTGARVGVKGLFQALFTLGSKSLAVLREQSRSYP